MVTIDGNDRSLADRILSSSSRDDIRASEREVAYFSMEIGLDSAIPTYSGGLGILAGDTIKSFADHGFPAVAVTLIHRQGYFQQQIGKDGMQNEAYPAWDPAEHMKKLKAKKPVTIKIAGEDVEVQAWLYRQEGQTGEVVPILFLDTNVPANKKSHIKKYTHHLYGRNVDYRIAQEMILGIAGPMMLEALGYNNIKKWHMNECHSAFLAYHRLKELKDVDLVKDTCVLTNHTPVGAGHDNFRYDDVARMMGRDDANELFGIAEADGKLNMTRLALKLSGYVNAVAKRHGEIAREQFPEFNVDHITNGVHSLTWTSYFLQQLFDKRMPGWSLNPMKVLTKAVDLDDYELLDAHRNAKRELLRHVNRIFPQVNMDPDVLTVGWARRFSDYKRADLLFHDAARLEKIARDGPVQFLIAGKAHPQDDESKKTIQTVIKNIMELSGKTKIAFLPNYNMEIGAMLTAGCDVWLNTPNPPWEASGTSGMKALHNGTVNLSVIDGWWCEGHKEGVTGFSIGPFRDVLLGNHRNDPQERAEDAEDMYTKLEKIIIPAFYKKKRQWAKLMKNSIALASYFNTSRMVQEYWDKAYKLS